MSKCLTSIQILRAMTEPENLENAGIMAHLYVCDKCLNALKEWRQGIDEAEYVPQPGDDEAAANAVKRVLEQQDAWKRLVNVCRKFFSSFNGLSLATPPQLVYAARRQQTTQVRRVTEAPVFLFDARSNVPAQYQWHAKMTLPIDAVVSPDIQIAIEFPPLPQDVSLPENLFFQGRTLPIEKGVAHISCMDFMSSVEQRGNGEIYVQFKQNNGQSYIAYGDLKPFAY